MRILVAEDDPVMSFLLRRTLTGWNYVVESVTTGTDAWERLQQNQAHCLALLDWEMPGLSGPELCERVRKLPQEQHPYLVLLTARDNPEDIARGLASGANDYLTKPFHPSELAARLSVAVRTIELQQRLATRVVELEQALAQVKQLRGMLPICAWCKKVRNDQNYWLQVEEYIGQHADVTFSHGICPGCMDRNLTPAKGAEKK
jgi:DNA-binding response OmpR family regulator